MHKFRRDVDHKLRVLRHADQIGDVGKACRYFDVGRASFYRWRAAYRQHGVAGLENRKTALKNPANRTAQEIVEKVLHLRKTYRLGPMRIVWYLARYHAITISDAGGLSHPQATWPQPTARRHACPQDPHPAIPVLTANQIRVY
jgi:transposase-like protein